MSQQQQSEEGLGESWLAQNKQIMDVESGVGLAGYTSALEKAIQESRAKKPQKQNFTLPPPPRPQAP